KEPRETLETPPEIEDEGYGSIFLQIGDQKVEQEGFPAAGAPQNHGVRGVTVVQVQEVRRAVIGFEHGQVFLTQVRVPGRARMERKQEGKVGIVGVQKIEVTQVEGMIPRHRRQESIEKVVALLIELGVMNAEDLIEFRGGPFDHRELWVVDDDGER